MTRRISIKKVKKRKLYTIKEAASDIGVCSKTVYRMIKDGLPVLEKNSNPIHFLGKDLLEFIKNKNSRFSIKLNDDEFFCFRCKIAVKSKPKEFQIFFTQKKWGKNFFQVKMVGICPKCNKGINKFSTDQKIKTLVKNGVFEQKHITVLIDT